MLIKKVLDNFNVEGFKSGITVDDRYGIYSPSGSFYIIEDIKDDQKNRWITEIWPLFITRTIESMSKESCILIDQDDKRIIVTLPIENNKPFIESFDYDKHDSIDMAKERAVLFILNQIKE